MLNLDFLMLKSHKKLANVDSFLCLPPKPLNKMKLHIMSVSLKHLISKNIFVVAKHFELKDPLLSFKNKPQFKTLEKKVLMYY